jgi:hypothetical protein
MSFEEPTQIADRIDERERRFEAEAWRVRKEGAPFWASVVIPPACNG